MSEYMALRLFDAAMDQIGDEFESLDAEILHKFKKLSDFISTGNEYILKKVNRKRITLLKHLDLQLQSKRLLSQTITTLLSNTRNAKVTSHHTHKQIPQLAFRFLFSSSPLLRNRPVHSNLSLVARLNDIDAIDPQSEESALDKYIGVDLFPITRDTETLKSELATELVIHSNELPCSYPRGICVHPINGIVYIAAWSSNNVLMFCPKSCESRNPNFRAMSVAVEDPCTIAINHTGTVLCVGCFNKHKLVFLNEGLQLVKEIPFSSISKTLKSPHCLSFDSSNNLFVVSAWVAVLKLEAETYNLVKAVPVKDVFGIMVNELDEVFLSGQNYAEIPVYSNDLEPIRTIPVECMGTNWTYLARGPLQSVVVADYAKNTVSIYNQQGVRIFSHTEKSPTDVKFGLEGELFVACYHSERITML
eukprot:TRINITY_DN11525_c0_g1_i1.p1 TRINITY_DN11525_c0_g1~~TRINITY_DN11525_c0_g1_i1.p1  ORF type:complete len:419 (+),score=68.28 TRINITY_DN11525_c0_g1_i1:90-1346(+)